MNNDTSRKVAFVAITALAIVLAVNVPGRARNGRSRGHGHHGFDGHHGFHGGFGFGPGYPYVPYDGYRRLRVRARLLVLRRSYGAYYPSGSCPEEWVPVPVS